MLTQLVYVKNSARPRRVQGSEIPFGESRNIDSRGLGDLWSRNGKNLRGCAFHCSRGSAHWLPDLSGASRLNFHYDGYYVRAGDAHGQRDDNSDKPLASAGRAAAIFDLAAVRRTPDRHALLSAAGGTTQPPR